MRATTGDAHARRVTASMDKRFVDGTHRTVSPAETVERVRPFLGAFGITRVANVTGLDHLGIPVVVVCRPNSRSLSVSQGKGLTLDAARASGIMESVESFHAERMTHPLKLASWHELRFDHDMADVARLPRTSISRFDPFYRLLWVEGDDLAAGTRRWRPYELVHLNLTLPLPQGSGCFPLGSNGLASGNTLAEATVHGICEVIERDAYALWRCGGGESLAGTRVDLDGVDDPGCRELLGRFAAGGMLVAAWEMTTDVGVPAFRCTIIDRETDPSRPLYPSSGMGCHVAREVALFRALAEAAQSRLTRISSSRDDVNREEYELTRNPDLLERVRRQMQEQPATRAFADAPTYWSTTSEQDLAWVLAQLRQHGFDSVLRVDLTRDGIGIPVVRIVIPGLETKPGGPGWQPGARADAVLAGVTGASRDHEDDVEDEDETEGDAERRAGAVDGA
jgi:ribosomal protein S12 methylthiotransferase accessory factor